MRVVVASPTEDCVAHRTLDAEDIDHDVQICHGPYGYCDLLAALWTFGEGVIIIEHDIAPWPGAIHQLQVCEQAWCAYEYPLNFSMVAALGCTKFATSLVDSTWTLALKLHEIHWGAVDGVLISRLELMGYKPHIHYPPVAHARRY